MRAIYTHFKLNCVCCPRVSYKDIPIIHEISHVLLPEQHLPGRGGGTRKLYKRYKNKSFPHPIVEKCNRSSSHCNSNLYSPTSVVGSWPFHIRNHTGIGLPYEVLQLMESLRIRTSLGRSLALGGRDSSLKRKHCTLGTSVTRPRCTARLTQQSMAPCGLINSTTREVGYTDVALGHSPLEAAGKELNEEEALLNCFDGS